MSQVETVSDKSGVAASPTLARSAISKGQISGVFFFSVADSENKISASWNHILLPESTAGCVGEDAHKSRAAPSI